MLRRTVPCDKDHGYLIFVNLFKMGIQSKQLSQSEVLVRNYDTCGCEFRIQGPILFPVPTLRRMPNAGGVMHIAAAIDRNRQIWQAPDEISTPVKVIV